MMQTPLNHRIQSGAAAWTSWHRQNKPLQSPGSKNASGQSKVPSLAICVAACCNLDHFRVAIRSHDADCAVYRTCLAVHTM
eukprot:1142241-Pelagomonas_calceolata.AAC.2